MRLPSRRSDDADVIRARLRALLAETRGPGGWVPEDDAPEEEFDDLDGYGAVPAEGWATATVDAERSDAELPSGLGRHRAPGPAVRLDPGRRGAWSLWAVGLAAALALVGWTWLDRPQVQPVAARPPTVDAAAGRTTAPPTPAVGEAGRTSTTVVVSVVGRVVHPGLVTVPTGARVADAVSAAGGLLPGADAATVNLAAVVTDGQQIAVGVPGSAGGAAAGGSSPGGASGGPVDLNAATVADLDALPGIGPVLAQRIVDYRGQQGPFTSVQQLDDVPGIGPAIFAELVKLVRV